MKTKMIACLAAAAAIVESYRAQAPKGFDPQNVADPANPTLDDVITDMTEETTTIGGIQAFIDGLKQQLTDALSGTTLPPAVQAKVDAVFTAAESNKAALATALTTNVPPPPGG
jgi:hypothetical protein